MQFNPADKSNSIIAKIDFFLFGTSTVFNDDFSLEDRTGGVNDSMDEIIAELFKADPNYMWDDTTNPDYPLATTDTVAGQPDYVFPDSSLVINRIRVKDINGSWKTLTPKLRREFTDEELAATGSPEYYFKIDNAVFPIPTPNYGFTDGIELEFQRGANHFVTTDLEKQPGFAAQFHLWLPVGAALMYAIANGMQQKIANLTALKETMRQKILEHYERRSPDERPKLRLPPPNTRNYGL